MDYKKYSSQTFMTLGRDSSAARNLAYSLERDVQATIYEALKPAAADVVEKLNFQGHQLSLIEDDEDLGISYVDTIGSTPKLRLGLDLVVSCGYSHLVDVDS